MIRRWLAPALFTLGLALGAFPSSARAQEEPPAEGGGGGRPFDGYFATGCLAGMVLFVIAKSARR